VCIIVAVKFILSTLIYIADIVVQSGGQQNGSAEDHSDISLPDGEHMDTDMQELTNDIENVCELFIL